MLLYLTTTRGFLNCLTTLGSFQSFKNSSSHDFTEPDMDISQLEPKDRIIEGLKHKLMRL